MKESQDPDIFGINFVTDMAHFPSWVTKSSCILGLVVAVFITVTRAPFLLIM